MQSVLDMLMSMPYTNLRFIIIIIIIIIIIGTCVCEQLYDFTAPQDSPTVIAYHPTQQAFACGFESGILRVFNVATTTMLIEHKYVHPFPFYQNSPTLFPGRRS